MTLCNPTSTGQCAVLLRARLIRLTLALAVFLAATPVNAEAIVDGMWALPATPETASRAIFSGLERIDETELAALRGGLSVGGIDVQFGATLRTLIDNIELTTSYRISEAGIDVLSQQLGTPSANAAAQQPAGVSKLTTTDANGNAIPISIVSAAPGSASANVAEVRAAPEGGAPVANPILVGPNTGASVADLAPAGLELSGIADYRGVVVNDVKGFTAALHDISHRAVVSALVSTASDRKISQRLNLDIRLGDVKQIRAAAAAAALSRSLRQR